MSHLPTLISDLALILVCAGLMTLLFKKLKQPLVLGYVVAGFLASPHMPYTPSVMDTANIQTWADLGVVFLLFALGLDFSLKKIAKVGGAAIIAACTIIFCMILLGMAVGSGFGWKRMDCLFLGGMIAMSSTTIIYKAFDDLGLRKKQFAGLVLSVLILEDIAYSGRYPGYRADGGTLDDGGEPQFRRGGNDGEHPEADVLPGTLVCSGHLPDTWAVKALPSADER